MVDNVVFINTQRRRQGLQPLAQKNILIRLTEEQRIKLNEEAKAQNMTLQSYCLQKLFR